MVETKFRYCSKTQGRGVSNNEAYKTRKQKKTNATERDREFGSQRIGFTRCLFEGSQPLKLISLFIGRGLCGKKTKVKTK